MAMIKEFRIIALVAAMALASYLGGQEPDGQGQNYALDPAATVEAQRLEADHTNAWKISPRPVSMSTANVDNMPIWRNTNI